MNYFIVCENFKKSGVEKKILAQAKVLKKLDNYTTIAISESSFFKRIFLAPYKILKKIKNAKTIYYRYTAPNIILHLALILFYKKKYIIEINTKNRDELKISSKMKLILNNIVEKALYKNAKKIICITNEIKEYIEKIYSGTPVKVMENGYSFPNVEEKKDKNIFLLLFGDGPELNNLKPKIDSCKNCFYNGKIDKNYLLSLYKNIDVAFSSFGLFRNNLREARPLKTREYLYFGVPVIYAYDENPILEKKDYMFKYYNNDKELEIFLEKTPYFNRDIIKNDAKELFDWEKIMSSVLK